MCVKTVCMFKVKNGQWSNTGIGLPLFAQLFSDSVVCSFLKIGLIYLFDNNIRPMLLTTDNTIIMEVSRVQKPHVKCYVNWII